MSEQREKVKSGRGRDDDITHEGATKSDNVDTREREREAR